LKKAQHILLVSHINPDGDALGSELGMYAVLKNAGKKVSAFNATKPLPSYLNFLPNFEKVSDPISGKNRFVYFV